MENSKLIEEARKEVDAYMAEQDPIEVTLEYSHGKKEGLLLEDKLVVVSRWPYDSLLLLHPVGAYNHNGDIPAKHVVMMDYMFEVEEEITIHAPGRFYEELTRKYAPRQEWFIIKIDGKQVYKTLSSRKWLKERDRLLKARKDGKVDKFYHLQTISPGEGVADFLYPNS